jgi:D-sedoheptulose 7-phosphate isomerase
MIKNYIQESLDLKNFILNDENLLHNITEIIKNVKNTLSSGHKILIAGNGGSAADAQHFAAELVGRYKLERKGYPAIALTTDSSIITAWSNDFAFDSVFSRQLEALGRPGDLFFGISTSGNSLNIIQAVKVAKKLGLKVVCLLGNKGGQLKDLADISMVVPSSNTPRIQEVHILMIHIICEEAEKQLI